MQGWTAPANLRERSSAFRVVICFLYFFLLNNRKDWCIFKSLWIFVGLITLFLFLRMLEAFEFLYLLKWFYIYPISLILNLISFNLLFRVWWLHSFSVSSLMKSRVMMVFFLHNWVISSTQPGNKIIRNLIQTRVINYKNIYVNLTKSKFKQNAS